MILKFCIVAISFSICTFLLWTLCFYVTWAIWDYLVKLSFYIQSYSVYKWMLDIWCIRLLSQIRCLNSVPFIVTYLENFLWCWFHFLRSEMLDIIFNLHYCISFSICTFYCEPAAYICSGYLRLLNQIKY